MLQDDQISPFIPVIGRSVLIDLIRRILEKYRDKAKSGQEIRQDAIVASILKNCTLKRMQMIQKVVNGTGVMIHTNLGRSPLGEKVCAKIIDIAAGYSNLEFHLTSERRGKRGGYCEELICHLSGAEDALIVNNCASSVFLILNCFARGEEVLVSRGELIQIGGGFRIPDIMRETGALLVEVGTTNITELDDYRSALTERTAMVFSAHHSNFRMEGFSRTPSIRELTELKSESVLLVRDLGSGSFMEEADTPRHFKPSVQDEVAQGPDLLCFSGDKLLGGCQAGIIVGKKDLIAQLRKHPLMRMLRVDKITYAILQEVLLQWDIKNHDDIGLWAMVMGGREKASHRITRFIRKLKHEKAKEHVKRIETRATFGGGSLPGMEMESVGLEIHIPGMSPNELYSFFLQQEIPVIGIIDNDRFYLDFMTILEEDVVHAATAADRLFLKHCGE